MLGNASKSSESTVTSLQALSNGAYLLSDVKTSSVTIVSTAMMKQLLLLLSAEDLKEEECVWSILPVSFQKNLYYYNILLLGSSGFAVLRQIVWLIVEE